MCVTPTQGATLACNGVVELHDVEVVCPTGAATELAVLLEILVELLTENNFFVAEPHNLGTAARRSECLAPQGKEWHQGGQDSTQCDEPQRHHKEHRSTGAQEHKEHRSTGAQGHRSPGAQEHRSTGAQEQEPMHVPS